MVYMCVCIQYSMCMCVRNRRTGEARWWKEQCSIPTSNSHRLSVYERQNAKPAGQRITSEPCPATHTPTDTHIHTANTSKTHIPSGRCNNSRCPAAWDTRVWHQTATEQTYQSPADQCTPNTLNHTHTHMHTHTPAALTNLLSTAQRARPTTPTATNIIQLQRSCSSECGNMHHLYARQGTAADF